MQSNIALSRLEFHCSNHTCSDSNCPDVVDGFNGALVRSDDHGHRVVCDEGYFVRGAGGGRPMNATRVKCCHSHRLRRRVWVAAGGGAKRCGDPDEDVEEVK